MMCEILILPTRCGISMMVNLDLRWGGLEGGDASPSAGTSYQAGIKQLPAVWIWQNGPFEWKTSFEGGSAWRKPRSRRWRPVLKLPGTLLSFLTHQTWYLATRQQGNTKLGNNKQTWYLYWLTMTHLTGLLHHLHLGTATWTLIQVWKEFQLFLVGPSFDISDYGGPVTLLWVSKSFRLE